MFVLRSLPLITVLLFILLQRINIRVTKSEELTVKINFNIFALVISDNQGKRNKKRRGFIKLFSPTLKSVNYLLSKSTAVIFRQEEKAFNNDVILMQNIFTKLFTEQFLISYIKRRSKSAVFNYDVKTDSEKRNTSAPTFDAIFHFSFIHLINSALIFTYYIMKNKAKKVLKNV